MRLVAQISNTRMWVRKKNYPKIILSLASPWPDLDFLKIFASTELDWHEKGSLAEAMCVSDLPLAWEPDVIMSLATPSFSQQRLKQAIYWLDRRNCSSAGKVSSYGDLLGCLLKIGGIEPTILVLSHVSHCSCTVDGISGKSDHLSFPEKPCRLTQAN